MARGYTTEDPWQNAMQGMNFLGNAMRVGQQIGEVRHEQDERDGVNKAYEYIVGKLGPSGDLSALENDPILFTRHGAQAAGKVVGDRMNTEKYRLEFFKNREAGDQKYLESFFMPQVDAAMQAFNKGDMASYSALINDVSASFPAPYKTRVRPDGNFDLLFRSDQHGDWVKKDVMTPQEVNAQLADMMNGTQNVLMGADMKPHPVNTRLLSMMARYRMGTAKKNAENLQDPSKWLTLAKSGHTIRVVPQNRHDDYSGGVNWMVLDDSGNMGGMIGSLEDLMRQGYRPLEVQAKEAQLRRTIAAGRGLGGTGGSGGMAFNLTESDKSWINKVSTTKDDMGNESFNPYIGMSLEILMGKHGLTRNSAFAAYDDAVTQAVSMAKAKNPNASETQLRQIAQKYIYQQLAGGGQSQKQPSGESADKPGSQFMEFGKQVEKATKGEKKQGTSSVENKSPESGHAKMVKGLTEVFEGIPILFTEGISGNGEEESLDPFGYEPFRR